MPIIIPGAPGIATPMTFCFVSLICIIYQIDGKLKFKWGSVASIVLLLLDLLELTTQLLLNPSSGSYSNDV